MTARALFRLGAYAGLALLLAAAGVPVAVGLAVGHVLQMAGHTWSVAVLVVASLLRETWGKAVSRA